MPEFKAKATITDCFASSIGRNFIWVPPSQALALWELIFICTHTVASINTLMANTVAATYRIRKLRQPLPQVVDTGG